MTGDGDLPTVCEACERDQYEVAWSEQVGRWLCLTCHLRLTAAGPLEPKPG